MIQAQQKIQTEIGELFLIASEHALQGVYFEEQHSPYITDNTHLCNDILRQAEIQFHEYFQGQRQQFDLPLDIVSGTPFQRKVWQRLGEINYGETISYQELAAAVGNSKASRAVGSANGKNPLSIIIPCHRVIASNKTLGGYAGGLTRKSTLLTLEQRLV